MSEKATPRPWKLYEHRLVTIIGGSLDVKVCDCTYAEGLKPTDEVRRINGINHTRKTDEAVANAELIVKCVNGYQALEAENAKLKYEYEKAYHKGYQDCLSHHEPERTELLADSERLREALQEIVNQVENEHFSEYMDTPYNKAKAALKGESLEK